MSPVYILSYAVAVIYLATFIYLIMIWSREDEDRK